MDRNRRAAWPLPNDIDPKIRKLVRALNSFDAVFTIGSCGGHPPPLKGGQWADGTWYVKFNLEHNTRGWRALEFLAWLINRDYARAGRHVELYPTAPPPYLNGPGQVLSFALEGFDAEDPDAVAGWMNSARRGLYVPAASPRRRPTTAKRTVKA
jgi:hypothetical protein